MSQTNVGLAGNVSRQVELDWIRLRRARLDVFAADVDSLPGELRFDTSQKHHYRLDSSEHSLSVFAEYRLDVLNDSRGAEREILVEAEFQLRYRVKPEFNAVEAELRWFAELNATLNSWPYWRELVQTVIGRAGIGSLTLPLWRAPSLPVDDEGNIRNPTVPGGAKR